MKKGFLFKKWKRKKNREANKIRILTSNWRNLVSWSNNWRTPWDNQKQITVALDKEEVYCLPLQLNPILIFFKKTYFYTKKNQIAFIQVNYNLVHLSGACSAIQCSKIILCHVFRNVIVSSFPWCDTWWCMIIVLLSVVFFSSSFLFFAR